MLPTATKRNKEAMNIPTIITTLSQDADVSSLTLSEPSPEVEVFEFSRWDDCYEGEQENELNVSTWHHPIRNVCKGEKIEGNKSDCRSSSGQWDTEADKFHGMRSFRFLRPSSRTTHTLRRRINESLSPPSFPKRKGTRSMSLRLRSPGAA